jgi:hypothetical protein
MTDKQKLKWEREIGASLRIDPDYVIVHKRQIPNPDYGSRSKILDPESIKIFDERRRKIRNINYYASELSFVRPTTDAPSLETVQVYAPFDSASDRQKRSKLEKVVHKIFQTT